MELFLTCLTIFPWAEQGIHYLKLLHMHDYALGQEPGIQGRIVYGQGILSVQIQNWQVEKQILPS